MNRIDMGYKHYQEFAENLLQVKLNHLIYQEAPLGETKWAKEELALFFKAPNNTNKLIIYLY